MRAPCHPTSFMTPGAWRRFLAGYLRSHWLIGALVGAALTLILTWLIAVAALVVITGLAGVR